MYISLWLYRKHSVLYLIAYSNDTRSKAWIQSVLVQSLVTPGVGWPLSFRLSFLLLPDREKGWNKPGAGVMIDDMPPLVHTSLLTHCCFSALIGQPCKLPSQCTWSPDLSKPPTQRNVWAIWLWLSTEPRPHCMSAPQRGLVYCVVHFCQTLSWVQWAINTDRWWEAVSILWKSREILSTFRKRTSMHVWNMLWKGLQTMTKHCNPDKSYLKFPRNVLSAGVLSGARIVCLSWLHQGWLS